MNFDELKALFDEFNLADFMPEVDTVLGWVETLLRLAVMAGPIVLLGFGLLYLFAPPKEANHALGYRFWWGMASLDAWSFTQRIAGIGWSVLGLVLTVVMAVICNGFRRIEVMEMAHLAGKCLLWELGLIAGVCLIIDALVIAAFDRRGFRRIWFEDLMHKIDRP